MPVEEEAPREKKEEGECRSQLQRQGDEEEGVLADGKW